jgi:hypothetical protein
MRFIFVYFAAVLISFAGCSDNPSKQISKEKNIASSQVNSVVSVDKDGVAVKPIEEAKKFKPFYVYSDKGSRENHFVPSGFMPDGECLDFKDTWKEKCYSGSTCMKIAYDVKRSQEGQKWAGIYWLNPPNNWGSRKGGFNLAGAQSLTFWAKGEVGGEQIEEFKVGGVEGNYPDTDVVVIGPVILSSEWKKYVVDLRGKDLSYISGGFAWSANADMNADTCTFYIDEIRFE